MVSLPFLGGTTAHVYDGEGHRVQKFGSGGGTVYVYDALGQLAAEYATASATASSCTPCYLSSDHLGSVRLVMSPSAQGFQVLARHDYLPFDQEVPTNGQERDGNRTEDVMGTPNRNHR